MEIPKAKLESMYDRMMRIRLFENRVKTLFAAGELPGFVHLYLGQEAIAAGVCALLKDDDYITSTHRGHGHILAKGGEMKYMMAELFGKSTGYNKGKGGSMHIAWPKLGILGANGILAAGIPIAAGAAFSAKYRRSGQVTACFFGDGAANEGGAHETMNIAAAMSLPIIFICENNLYAVGTYQPGVRNIEDIAERASAYGMPGVVIDGNDVVAVFETTNAAVERARSGDGPTLIECKTYRWHPHFEGESDTYRPPEEVASWKKREPIAPFRKALLSGGVFSEEELAIIDESIQQELDDAVEFARNSPFAAPESALEDLWA